MGKASGAGVIFGNTGGVMEAALRTAYEYLTGQAAPRELLHLSPLRGYEGVREAQVQIGDLTLQVAVVYGTANARVPSSGDEGKRQTVPLCGSDGLSRRLHRRRRTAQESAEECREIRKKPHCALYRRDEAMTLRTSHENPEIIEVYKTFYGKPLSELAEKMLHTTYRTEANSCIERKKNL